MRITFRGIGLLTAAGLLLGAGFRFGYPELALLGVAAVIALAGAAGSAGWQPRLTVRREAQPDRVSRGESARMTLTVRNTGWLRSADLVAEDRCGARSVAVPLLRLRPGRDSTVSYPVPTRRRGVIQVGPLRVTGRDALGLITSVRSYGETVRIWVHPQVHPLSAVPTGVARSLDGRYDRVPHGSITFDSLREYVVGDELRRVHWRTSARVGELMVREQLDTSLPRLVVLLDNRARSYGRPVDGVVETFESACEAAASVLVAARRADLPVLLTLVVPEVADGVRGDLDRLAAATLHRAPSDGGPDPLRSCLRGLHRQHLGDTVVFLSGPGASGDLGQLAMLRPAYPSLVAVLFDPTAEAPAAAGDLLVISAPDGAGFAARWDGTALAARWDGMLR